MPGGRSRGWCFTLNNYEQKDEESIKSINHRYLIYGREEGESGTPHLQGFVYFEHKKSLKQMKEMIPRAHFEVQRGTCSQAAEYCRKEGNVYEEGEVPGIGRPKGSVIERNSMLLRLPLEELVSTGEISVFSIPTIKKARTIMAQECASYSHESVRGEWYVGPPGTGKSRKAREENPDAYIKAQNKWFDGYTGQDVIILDDLDTNMLGHYLKIWGDRYSCAGEIKGGVVNLKHKKFIVTSNYTIGQLWETDQQMQEAIERRFKVTVFGGFISS